MARLRYNGLTATLGADLLTAGTTITFASALQHAAGAVPTITGTDYIPLSILADDGTVLEIMHLTAYTTGATTGTVLRAQESTTATDHGAGLRVVHGITVADMSTSGGDGWVELSVADYADLATAIAALPATGGTVLVPDGRWLGGDFSTAMTKPDVRILGTQMPRLSATLDRLEGGAIIECNDGGFSAYAHGLHVENVGFDLGKYVSDTYYASDPQTNGATSPTGDWTAFGLAYPGQVGTARNGVHLRNIIGLLRSPSSVGHALLLEAIDGGTADNVTGVGGTHAVAIKSTNMQIGRVVGYCASSNHVIIKADSYAACGDLTIDQIDCDNAAPYGTAHFALVQAPNGIYIQAATADLGAVSIGQAGSRGASNMFAVARSSTYTIERVTVGTLNCVDGDTAVNIDQRAVLDFHIGDLHVKDSIRGVLADSDSGSSTRPAHIGAATILTATGPNNRAFQLSNYARLVVDSVVAEVTNAYDIAATARLLVGAERVTATTKWVNSPPALTANWSNTGGGNSSFGISLERYGVRATGTVSSNGASGQIAFVPAYLTAAANTRVAGGAYISSVLQSVPIGTYTDSSIAVNDGAAVASGSWVCIDALWWPL